MKSELEKIIETLYDRYKESVGNGKVADYIPTLKLVNPDQYAISVATVDGEYYNIGDYKTQFTIQSISKVFTLAMLAPRLGNELWKYVGREPSGNSFNSLVQLENERGIPRNPFINAGALVVTDKLLDFANGGLKIDRANCKGGFRENVKQEILQFVRDLCGCKSVDYDYESASAEMLTAECNYALAHFMKSFGNIDNPINDVIDVYCHHCSIKMNTEQLAKAFLFLANGGVNPINGEAVVGKRSAKRINALMLTCGLYNESGDFAYRVGLPGKSGVGGGIAAVIPGKLSIAVWSPELNANGNSYRGISTLEDFTTELGISVF